MPIPQADTYMHASASHSWVPSDAFYPLNGHALDVYSGTQLPVSAEPGIDNGTVELSPSALAEIAETGPEDAEVNPAFLSQVAKAFVATVPLRFRSTTFASAFGKPAPNKPNSDINSIGMGNDSFLGCDAVDAVMSITRTPDRDLALVVGRSLDAQHLFHDALGQRRRLRDSAKQLYKFGPENRQTGLISAGPFADAFINGIPQGVIVPLARCYSYSCAKDCYSPTCRSHMQKTKESMRKSYISPGFENSQKKLWKSLVPLDLLKEITETEQERQQYIFEFIRMEKQLVDDLVFLQKVLEAMFEISLMGSVLEGMYVATAELRTVNERFLDRLRRRQENEFPVVGMIGDLCMEELSSFAVFADYGTKVSDALQAVRDLKSENPEFAEFFIHWEAWSESQFGTRRNFESSMQSPVHHLSRLTILLERISKRTSSTVPSSSSQLCHSTALIQHPDSLILSQIIQSMSDVQKQVSSAAGSNLLSASSNLVLMGSERNVPTWMRGVAMDERAIQVAMMGADAVELKDGPSSTPAATVQQSHHGKHHDKQNEQQRHHSQGPSGQYAPVPTSANEVKSIEEARYWYETVTRDLRDGLTKDEIQRQEKIFELAKTQDNFVKNLEFLEEVAERFRTSTKSGFHDEVKREEFAGKIFLDTSAILAMNRSFLAELRERQRECLIVDRIADVLLRNFCEFQPFHDYCCKLTMAKHYFIEEKANNAEFENWVEECSKLPAAARRGLDVFINLPFTRMANLTMLLKDLTKYTNPEDHAEESQLLAEAISVFNEFQRKMNAEAGRMDDEFMMKAISERLNWGAFHTDLKLNAPGRRLIRHGTVKLKERSGEVEVYMMLFDHFILLTRPKSGRTYKVYAKPIPLELLALEEEYETPKDSSEGTANLNRSASTHSKHQLPIRTSLSTIRGHIRGGSSSHTSDAVSVHSVSAKSAAGQASNAASEGEKSTSSTGGTAVAANNGPQSVSSTSNTVFTLTLTQLGKKDGSYAFILASEAEKIAWQTDISRQRQGLTEASRVLEVVPVVLEEGDGNSSNGRLNDGMNSDGESESPVACISGTIKFTCATKIGRDLVLGAEDGVYLVRNVAFEPSFIGSYGVNMVSRTPSKVLDLERVTQIDAIAEHDLLIVLADKVLQTYSLDALDNPFPASSTYSLMNQRNMRRKVGTGVSYFKVGGIDRKLVVSAKSSQLDSKFKVFEAVSQPHRSGAGRSGELKFWKEFYIPSESRSVFFSKMKVLVGANKGFEIVDLETLKTAELLDPRDGGLDFANKESYKAMAFFRTEDGNFLLCYNKIAFYVDRTGKRAKEDWMVHWIGSPVAFARINQFILAFDPTFIEIRHVETGFLQQVIPVRNLRTLTTHATMDSPFPVCAVEVGPASSAVSMVSSRAHLTSVAQQQIVTLRYIPGMEPRPPVAPAQIMPQGAFMPLAAYQARMNLGASVQGFRPPPVMRMPMISAAANSNFRPVRPYLYPQQLGPSRGPMVVYRPGVPMYVPSASVRPGVPAMGAFAPPPLQYQPAYAKAPPAPAPNFQSRLSMDQMSLPDISEEEARNTPTPPPGGQNRLSIASTFSEIDGQFGRWTQSGAPAGGPHPAPGLNGAAQPAMAFRAPQGHIYYMANNPAGGGRPAVVGMQQPLQRIITTIPVASPYIGGPPHSMQRAASFSGPTGGMGTTFDGAPRPVRTSAMAAPGATWIDPSTGVPPVHRHSVASAPMVVQMPMMVARPPGMPVLTQQQMLHQQQLYAQQQHLQQHQQPYQR
ncbi:CNH domain-containing protein [Cladochytrium replicatum]|nr:CNH domain-containing protein [Cladochytrium replicatum]